MNTEITSALTEVSTELTAQLNVGTVAAIIGLVLGSAISLFLLWFGIRKLITVTKNAIKGRLRI